ncbi:MAG: efflux RND transporter periplasmic adaptor subunit, partial [Deltaproteobacteria bacterium]|nr:efflux RND transporter periplasmic adaptor subunit [Deltaproteobacteria bacterium]
AGRLAFDPELYAAQNEYIEAIKQVESVKNSPLADVKQSAERMLDSAKLRLKILGLSDSQIKNLAAQDFNDARLLLKTGGSAWVYAEIFEMDLPLVRSGLSAEITARFLGGQVVAGKVVSIDRIINPATRTAKARILVSDVRSLLRPESYVDVNILAPLGEQITVPFDALFDTGKQAWVFVADEQGKFEPRLVTLKFHVGSEVALASGVKEGEKIVTSANFLIDSESRLKGVLMGAEGTADKKSAPSCPQGQRWDEAMKMCM